MRSSRTISLFSDRPEPIERPYSFLVSILVHAAGIGLIALGVLYAPRIRGRSPDDFVLRRVDLNRKDAEMRRLRGSGAMYPSPEAAGNAAPSAGKPSAPASSRLRLANLTHSTRTLIQPDLPPIQMQAKVPLPALFLWSAQKAKVQAITPPVPQPPAKAMMQPKLDIPNKEVQLADIAISSTAFRSKTPMPLPSNTSPVVVHLDVPEQRMPETTSASNHPPTSAAVLSASDLRMTQGTAVLPPANESAPGNSPGALGAGNAPNGLQTGNSTSNGSDASKGAGKNDGGGGQGSGTGKAGAQKGVGNGTKGVGTGGGSGQGHKAGEGTGQGSGRGPGDIAGPGSGQDDGGSVTRISLPKSGQFGVVVVGSTMEDQYPETGEVWTGRLAYSVYLHVGMAKSWILQYALPRSVDTAAGGVPHIEAPWPYYIVRPNLADDDWTADAVMVHGYVNESGHFEELSVVFPNGLAEAPFVLGSLRQWQFRPGKSNGQVSRLEVLLIIPETTD